MTIEQLDHLRRILDRASTPGQTHQPKATSEQWRSVHTKEEISLGTVLRRDEYCGPTDWRR